MMKNPPHPGRIVRDELLEPFGLTVGQAAEALGVSRPHLSNLLNEKAGITPEMAIRLSTNLRSQFATSSLSTAWGGRRYPPYAFTEHGAIMAATILNTPRATEISVYVVRAFVQLREVLATHKELAQRLNELETKIERKLAGHDQAIAGIITAIRELMAPPESTAKKRTIGFVTSKEK